MNPLVSVLIDTYNYGQFIEQAVGSALAQDFPAEQMEVLVVDDGSTDDTGERLAKFSGRIQYFQKPNGGQASAFNFGLARARGDVVAFLDADDYWLPGKLRRVTAEFEKNPGAGMVYHRMLERLESTGETREALFIPLSGDLSNDIGSLREYRVYPTSSLSFRRTLLENLCPIPEAIRLQADAYLALLAVLAAPIQAIPDCLAVYRIHGQNLFATGHGGFTPERRKRQFDTWGIILREVESWVAAGGSDPAGPAARTLLERHFLYRKDMEFGLHPPGRIKFFRFQLRKNRLNRDVCTPKLRAINRFNAFASLFTGYRHFGALDAFWRKLDQAKDAITSLFGRRTARSSGEPVK
jgi:glycosyltransferase involved in cell wall biosynthesis